MLMNQTFGQNQEKIMGACKSKDTFVLLHDNTAGFMEKTLLAKTV